MRRPRWVYIWSWLLRLWFLSPLLCLNGVLASPAAEPRARLSSAGGSYSEVTYSPIALDGGSRLTLVSPVRWSSLSRRLGSALTKAHRDYVALLGTVPPLNTSIHLMEEEDFFVQTNAPRWTNALYFRGRITLPISLEEPLNYDNLVRSVRHEYTHAVVNTLSAGRCPGWLDEGLAQWAEGRENPALRPALRAWLRRHTPVPLSRLQGGFTKLEPVMVPAAYAQALFFTRLIVSSFGFKVIRRYFDLLREGGDKNSSFLRAFGLEEKDFEERAGAAARKMI